MTKVTEMSIQPAAESATTWPAQNLSRKKEKANISPFALDGHAVPNYFLSTDFTEPIPRISKPPTAYINFAVLFVLEKYRRKSDLSTLITATPSLQKVTEHFIEGRERVWL